MTISWLLPRKDRKTMYAVTNLDIPPQRCQGPIDTISCKLTRPTSSCTHGSSPASKSTYSAVVKHDLEAGDREHFLISYRLHLPAWMLLLLLCAPRLLLFFLTRTRTPHFSSISIHPPLPCSLPLILILTTITACYSNRKHEGLLPAQRHCSLRASHHSCQRCSRTQNHSRLLGSPRRRPLDRLQLLRHPRRSR